MNTHTVQAAGDWVQKGVRRLGLAGVFLMLFLLFGCMFILITPPGWNTDETNHVYRVFQLSRGNLLSEQVVDPQSGYKAFGGLVPTNMVRLFDMTGARLPGSVGNVQWKIDKQLYQRQPRVRSLRDDGQLMPINFSGAALYSPVTYALYIPVFWLGKLLSMPLYWIILLSRLVGLVATGVALFAAIKALPVGKWMLFAVGLLPGVVAQSASVTADAPQLAVTILFFALVARLIYRPQRLRWWDYGMLLTLGVALPLTKLVYAPVVLLLLAMPLIRPEYRQRRTITLLAGVVVLSLLPAAIWMQMVSYVDINSNPQADFAKQKLFILHEPFMYARTLYYSLATNLQTGLNNLFGAFVWDSAPLPALFAYLAAFAVMGSLVVVSSSERGAKLAVRQLRLWRASLLAVVAATSLLIATALYVYSSTYRATTVVGIQSRYFLPLMPLLLMAFYGNTVKNQRSIKLGIVVLSAVVLMGAVATVYQRLYLTVPLVM